MEFFLKGILTGSGLIIAIGAQNAFVLSQGVKKNHIIVIPLICALCDGCLIFIGVAGAGTVFSSSKFLTLLAGWGGAAFLFWYGFESFKSLLKTNTLKLDKNSNLSLKKAIIATLAITLLNPHVYLDTVVLIGSISAQYKTSGRYLFGAGAATASFIWFFSLGAGGKLLSPLFQNPLAWKFLDGFVGITMWIIGASLILK